MDSRSVPGGRLYQGKSVPIATADEFESHRPRMFGLAYRMLGSAEEAEDTVQDAYPRWSGTDRGAIGRPGRLAREGGHGALSRPAHLGQGAARAVRGAVAARARAHP
ncbi:MULTISPECIES: sigma factor [unclassified Streptomyces]|uniref:sigma factor n=1 Tax=unclassified Streptomyces TaxID=2593676 RepID=UPI003867182B